MVMPAAGVGHLCYFLFFLFPLLFCLPLPGVLRRPYIHNFFLLPLKAPLFLARHTPPVRCDRRVCTSCFPRQRRLANVLSPWSTSNITPPTCKLVGKKLHSHHSPLLSVSEIATSIWAVWGSPSVRLVCEVRTERSAASLEAWCRYLGINNLRRI